MGRIDDGNPWRRWRHRPETGKAPGIVFALRKEGDVREFQAGYVPAARCVGVSTQVHLQMRRRSDGQVLSLLLSLLALLVQKYKH